MTDTLQAPTRVQVLTESRWRSRSMLAWGGLLVGVVALQVAFSRVEAFPGALGHGHLRADR